jgi:ABC-2 type transport system ATP-binding protein
MDELAERYAEVAVHPDKVNELRELGPISEQQSFGRTIMLFEDKPRDRFKGYGEVRTPNIADLFVAKMKATRK